MAQALDWSRMCCMDIHDLNLIGIVAIDGNPAIIDWDLNRGCKVNSG